jgi:hypothetical protein
MGVVTSLQVSLEEYDENGQGDVAKLSDLDVFGKRAQANYPGGGSAAGSDAGSAYGGSVVDGKRGSTRSAAMAGLDVSDGSDSDEDGAASMSSRGPC